MKVYIQHKNGAPYSVAAGLVQTGFAQRGFELQPFEISEIETIDWQREDVVVGGVGTYRRIFDRLGILWTPTTYPNDLRHFLQRKISVKELGALTVADLPAFLKPVQDNKAFTGFVCHDPFDPRLSPLPPDLPVYLSEIVEFVTEYRVYVLDGKILNLARYTGAVDHFPNPKTVRGMIMAYRAAPIAYTLDIGVTLGGDTLLVESNEPLSLANYGLSPILASKMVSARWNQLAGLDYRADATCQDSPSFITVH